MPADCSLHHSLLSYTKYASISDLMGSCGPYHTAGLGSGRPLPTADLVYLPWGLQGCLCPESQMDLVVKGVLAHTPHPAVSALL